ncbi:MAG: GrdX family protein [Bacillota bacterium]
MEAAKDELVLVTNNPLCLSKARENGIETVECDGLTQVIKCSRDLIHKGYKLVNHPLAGSVKPWANPYRSIMLIEGDSLDVDSLKVMENAINKYDQFEKDLTEDYLEKISEPIRQDYSLIDYELIKEMI